MFDELYINNLKIINQKLNITDDYKNIIFVYTQQKVGSTSLVSSLRLFALESYIIIHAHDDKCIKIFTNVENITMKDLIVYNNSIGKNVFVIDIYREPIEHKISAYFENIAYFHFNNNENNLNSYPIQKIIHRFNCIFPYIVEKDYFFELFDIPVHPDFDHEKKYMIIIHNNITYIKLIKSFSHLWGDILTHIFHHKICVIQDYKTDKKIISDLYSKFKYNYKIPINFLENIKSNKYFKYYFNEKEQENYIKLWSSKVDKPFNHFTRNEYELYNRISIENCRYFINNNHYFDQGCICKTCFKKRYSIRNKIFKGELIQPSILHDENIKKNVASNIRKKITLIKKINKFNNQIRNNKNKTFLRIMR